MNNANSFDKEISLNQDLTFHYAEQYFANLKIKFESLQKRIFKVVDENGNYTNTALLLSDQCEHTIKFALFEGNTKERFKARNEFKGSILKQLDEAYAYMELNNHTHSIFKGLRRIDCPEYPVVALRETLMNAAVHRDYCSPVSTMINVYTDRMEFVTIGGLAYNLTMHDVLNGISLSRNSWLAQVFHKLGLFEGLGTGIQRTINGYSNFPVKPAFTPAPASFLVVLPNTHVNASIGATDIPFGIENPMAATTMTEKEKVYEAPINEPPRQEIATKLTPPTPLAREVTNCLICGCTLRNRRDSICPICMINDDLLIRTVRNYVDEHPEHPMQDVAAYTGVPTRKLIQFLRDERIKIESKSLEEGFLQCLRCHSPIRSGKLCKECRQPFSEIADLMQQERLLKINGISKQHTFNSKRD